MEGFGFGLVEVMVPGLMTGRLLALVACFRTYVYGEREYIRGKSSLRNLSICPASCAVETEVMKLACVDWISNEEQGLYGYPVTFLYLWLVLMGWL